MSKLRFPFRSQTATNVPQYTPPSAKELADADYWSTVDQMYTGKGKAKEVERLWGLENFGNTCYCNSVLQALYACDPFRTFVESYPNIPPPIWPLAPPAGTANVPKTPGVEAAVVPGSPLAITRGNPFDNPSLTNGGSSPSTPGADSKKEKSRGLFGRRPTSSSSAAPSLASMQQKHAVELPPTPSATQQQQALLDAPAVPLNPDQPPPSVFETIQTLFYHLSSAAPHQPLAPKKAKDVNPETAQTASLLPAANGTLPTPPASGDKAGAKKEEPAGPPLLASLPPPSAPRGGGPFSAGSLGRGVVRPEDLLKTVKRENEMFRGMSQQDAHEFLGWVLNKVAEDVDLIDRDLKSKGKEVAENRGAGKTWVQALFEGTLTNETKCLSCEMTSSRDEPFLDLSIDIEQHHSVTSCLRQFSSSEMLCQKNKFYCDSCCGLQEAEKRMKIKTLPNILALHLKRFKYQEALGRYTKLFYRVPFPTQLRLPNTTEDTADPDRLYELFAVVVHIGNGPHHGHYVCVVRSGGRWVMCDDENVEPIDDADIYRYFGDYPSGAGYVLFYQSVDLNLAELGLKKRQPRPTPEAGPIPAIVQEHRDRLVNIAELDETSPRQGSAGTIPASQSTFAPPVASPPVVSPPVINTPSVPIIAPPVSPKIAMPQVQKPAVSQPLVTPPIVSTTAPSPPAAPRLNGNSAPTLAQLRSAPSPVIAPSLAIPNQKDKDSKWYQRRKSVDKPNEKRNSLLTSSAPSQNSSRPGTSASAGSASTTPFNANRLQRQGTSQTIQTFSSSTSAGTGFNNVHESEETSAAIHTPSMRRQSNTQDSPANMSSSMMSNMSALSGSSNSQSAAGSVGVGASPTPASGFGVARQPSQRARDRTTSAGSSSSGATPGSFGADSIGGGLTRKQSTGGSLSRIGSKLSRSSSSTFGKLGLGKKDRNGSGGMKGVQE